VPSAFFAALRKPISARDRPRARIGARGSVRVRLPGVCDTSFAGAPRFACDTSDAVTSSSLLAFASSSLLASSLHVTTMSRVSVIPASMSRLLLLLLLFLAALAGTSASASAAAAASDAEEADVVPPTFTGTDAAGASRKLLFNTGGFSGNTGGFSGDTGFNGFNDNDNDNTGGFNDHYADGFNDYTVGFSGNRGGFSGGNRGGFNDNKGEGRGEGRGEGGGEGRGEGMGRRPGQAEPKSAQCEPLGPGRDAREKDKERGGRLAEDDDNYNRRAREEREQREKDSGFIRSGKDRGGKDDAGGKDEWGK